MMTRNGIEIIVSAAVSAAKSASAAGYLLGVAPWATMAVLTVTVVYMIVFDN